MLQRSLKITACCFFLAWLKSNQWPTKNYFQFCKSNTTLSCLFLCRLLRQLHVQSLSRRLENVRYATYCKFIETLILFIYTFLPQPVKHAYTKDKTTAWTTSTTSIVHTSMKNASNYRDCILLAPFEALRFSRVG